ncbi:PAS domain S-box protein [Carboxylicivirga sp. M1479]|uniref:PAS domain S-box protein n=1 Tax=Carboxylicivirga sp. M1479 TaxID=2594476 RepID=UPI0011787073|nr:PAS domain S-box protein [Carboxylicivirga sp. M1479]TRX72600.1 PAS domain S-box protein [Carboxylicivirga sp. M1479]
MEINKEQALLAENARLKRIMKRMYQGAWGLPFVSKNNETISGGNLPLYLSSLLASNVPFKERVNQTLSELGRFADVSRIYIFENQTNSELFSNSYEWCNDGVQSTKADLQDLSYSHFTEWRRLLVEDGSIQASDIHTLPEEVRNTLSDQGILSILVYPLWVKDEFYGFIGFDECSFNREWMPHETDLLQLAARLIANAIEREAVTNEIRENHLKLIQVNEELADKERFLQNILTSAPLGIILVRKRKIEYINNATIAQSGYTQEELVGKSLSELYFDGKEDHEQIQRFYNEIDKNGVASLEAHMKSKHNDELILRVLGTPAPQSAGTGSYLLIGEDITHVKNTESHLRESEERNRKLIEATNDGIFIINDKMQLVYANTSACEMLQHTHEDIFLLNVEDIFPSKEFIERFYHTIKRVNDGVDYKGDTQLINSQKEIVHAEIYVTNLNLEGNLHYYVSIHNITKRKRNEASLKGSEQKFRALTENSPDHILRIDNDGILSYCNSAFYNDFKLSALQCIDKELNEVHELPKELVDGLKAKVNEVLQTKMATNLELEYRFEDTIKAFDWTITPETSNSQLSSILIVGRDYTQKKKAEQELLIAKEKAVGADRLKSAFLANMSHEIRTPLNAIVGFTNLLKEDNISEAEKIEYIDIVNKSSENLMELINDIVDLAKIESGELRLTNEEFNVIELLQELHLVFEKRMAIDRKMHLKFYINLPDQRQTLQLKSDHRRLRQVFINLLGNAFKFTQKGFIEFGYELQAESIRFFVRDTGIGIPADKQSFIFEPFRQADESTSKNYGGTGLGLSICKRLVAALGGDMGLKSEQTTGSEFYFNIPLTSKIASNNNVNGNGASKKLSSAKVEMSANYTWPNKMMLLIDATSTAQLQMRKVLDRTKITLISARTQKSARELLLKRNDIHIVLLDLEMPGLELDEFIPSIRQMGIYVPFIGQTSQKLTDADKEKYRKMGFSNIFEKPVNNNELLHAFNDSLNGVSVE